MRNNFNIIISGVGGQGAVTLTQILAEAALREGYDVKTSELHGLSQRGGSIETHIRFGGKVYSPLVPSSRADLILGLEVTEGLRVVSYANKKTLFLINKSYISFIDGLPEEAVIKKINSLLRNKVYLIPASQVCKEKLGTEMVAGAYLLGFAIAKKIIPLKVGSLLYAIGKVIPKKHIEINKKSFELARHQ